MCRPRTRKDEKGDGGAAGILRDNSKKMTVNISRNRRLPECGFCATRLQIFARKILMEFECPDAAVNIHFTSDEDIQQLNRAYRNRDVPTNVLSFPSDADLPEEIAGFSAGRELGDIVISLESAAAEAKLYNKQFTHRLAWLIAHGLLHLLGYDHERSLDEAESMAAREEELLTTYFTNRRTTMPQLAINVDHVATIRQARGISQPDPVFAASLCELAGASGIVVHLREDRRHIQDRDIYLLRKTIKTKMNLEMGANKEIIDIALDVVPDMITLVPEKRRELTTEGGLDVISQKKKLKKVINSFNKANIPVSIFLDPDTDQIKAAQDIGATLVEIHTGRYCDAVTEQQRDKEFELIALAADEAYQLGLIVNGGHGLDYNNTGRIAALETIDELSIGHAVIARAVFTGLEKAVQDMLAIMRNAQQQMY